MAVRLRLRRVGRKKLPIYKVVAADSRSPRDGRFIEAVGQYEPLRKSNNIELNEERVMYWLKNGAQPTDTVRNLLQSKGIWLKWSLEKKGAEETVITERLEKFQIEKAEKEKRAAEKETGKKAEKSKKQEETETAEPSSSVTDDQTAETPADTVPAPDAKTDTKTAESEESPAPGSPDEEKSEPPAAESDKQETDK